MRRTGLFIFFLIILLLALIPSANRYWEYYGFFPWDTPPRRSVVAPPEYTSENVLDVLMPEQNSFVDNPEMGDGLILLDLAHDNNFKLPEIGALDGRLAARGFEFLEYEEGDLARQLRGVNAFVVIAPLANYSDLEIEAVNDFVEDGGRLLLMGDPTRFTVDFVLDDFGSLIDFNFITNELPLNDLANPFDISFEGDYLYNLTNEGNESNFRNIVVTGDQFAASSLTTDLDTVVMYGAHSLEIGASALPLLYAGETTYSSATDRAGGRLIGAITEDEQVLALGDITFMSDPYYTTLDNERFIARIADFLTAERTAGRSYELADFPYFLDGAIELHYTGDVDLGPGAFDDIISLQNSFAAVDQQLTLTANPSGDNHVLHLGLYNQALTDDAVLALLAEAGMELTIDPEVLTIAEQIELREAEKAAEAKAAAEAEAAKEEDEDSEDDEPIEEEAEEEMEEEEYIEIIQVIESPLGRIEMPGTSLILLSEDGNGRYEIVVLAASQEGLENTTNRLLDLMPLDSDYALDDCLTTAVLALCPSDVSNEEVEPELITGIEQELPGEEKNEEKEEEPVEEDDEPVPVEEDLPRSSIDDLDGELADQGAVSLDEPFSGELATEEFHTWTYEGDEITADILVTTDEALDAILSVYDEEGLLTELADQELVGADEELNAVVLSDGYLIVVNDLDLDDTGAYTVTVTIADEAPAEDEEEKEEEDSEEPTDTAGGLEKIFVYIDDDGTFLGDDEAATVDLTALIPDQYEVTPWQASKQDDRLEITDLDGFDLIIWHTAEYREPDFTFTDEANVLFEAIFEGGNMLIVGATPPTLEPAELVDLSAVRFAEHPILEGLDITFDEPFPLGQTVSTSLFELVEDDLSDGEDIFVFRADEDDYIDNAVGAAVDDEISKTRFILLTIPLQVFDEGVQAQFIDNVLVWFSENSGE